MRKGIPVWAEIPLLVGLKPPLRWKSMKCFTKVQRFSRPTNLFPFLFLPILLFIRKRCYARKMEAHIPGTWSARRTDRPSRTTRQTRRATTPMCPQAPYIWHTPISSTSIASPGDLLGQRKEVLSNWGGEPVVFAPFLYYLVDYTSKISNHFEDLRLRD